MRSQQLPLGVPEKRDVVHLVEGNSPLFQAIANGANESCNQDHHPTKGVESLNAKIRPSFDWGGFLIGSPDSIQTKAAVDLGGKKFHPVDHQIQNAGILFLEKQTICILCSQ